MIIGALLLILVHGVFSLPINNWMVALVAILTLGIAFSLVPSAMWPSVPKIIPEKQLGTAYAMIFFIQNIGLGGVPALIGWILTKYCQRGTLESGSPAYDYTLPMLVFMLCGVLALLVSLALKIVDRKKGYGLELPNINK
jgi:MFS family permease